MVRTAALAALLIALLAPPAQAQVVLGPGDRPNVTVDGQGTAYITWNGVGIETPLFFCRLPRGATVCSPRTEIAVPGDSLSIPIAVGAGNAVRVVSYRYGLAGPSFAAAMLFSSNNGGATFDEGPSVGSISPWDLEIGSGAAVSGITNADACGTCFQRLPFDGGPVTGPAVLSSTHPYQGTLALLDGATPLAVYTDGSANAQFRRYGGAGDVNDAASWTPPVDIGVADVPHLAYGSSGVFMLARPQLSGGQLQARRFDGNTFGAPTTIAHTGAADDAVQDPGGRLHVVAPTFVTGAALFYATSDDGVRWDTLNLPFKGVPARMRLAVAGDHLGAAVGRFASGPRTGSVWMLPIGPSAVPPRLGKTALARVVSGTVRVKLPRGRSFNPLGADIIPVGSTVDTTKGRVQLTMALPGGKLNSSDFFEGVFKLTQAKTGLTTLELTGGSFKSCGSASRARAAKVKVIRHLWGDGQGKFRTKARYAAGSLRGTRWDTIDRCDGTLIRVTQGSVLVRDLKKRRNIVVRAGKSYLAEA